MLQQLVQGDRCCHGPLMSFLTTEAAQRGLGMAGVAPFPTAERGAGAGGLTKRRLAGGLMSAGEPGRGTSTSLQQDPGPAAPFFPIITVAGSIRKTHSIRHFPPSTFGGVRNINPQTPEMVGSEPSH